MVSYTNDNNACLKRLEQNLEKMKQTESENVQFQKGNEIFKKRFYEIILRLQSKERKKYGNAGLGMTFHIIKN